MGHPYTSFERNPVWRAVESALLSLERNRDLTLSSPREYVIGFLVANLGGHGLLGPAALTSNDDAGVLRWPEVLLSVQRALLGEVTPQMRAVSVELSAAELRIWVFVDGLSSAELAEGLDAAVATQVVADFPYPERGDPVVSLHVVRCDSPTVLSPRGRWVFVRHEESATPAA